MHDLQDDQDPERARRPDQMVVEAERGGVVFLHKSPFGLLGRKQPARHAIAERRGRYARHKSFADLLKASCQQP